MPLHHQFRISRLEPGALIKSCLIIAQLYACGGGSNSSSSSGSGSDNRQLSESFRDGATDSATASADDSAIDSASDSEDGVCTACDERCEEAQEEEALKLEQAEHVVTPITYADPPPTSGSHHPCWGDYRVYDEARPLPAERWVHNLEHGGVVFLYHCPAGCQEDVTNLTALTEDLPRTLLTVYTEMEPGFAAVAWGHRLLSTCLDLDAFRAFYQAHYDQGPESISEGEPATCQDL